MGRAWRSGETVLKPLDLLPDEIAWLARSLPGLRSLGGIRLAEPLRAHDGRLVVHGWTAWRYLPGRHETARWPEIIAVGERLSAALADLARPAFIDERTHAWATADRAAWGELPLEPYLADARVAACAALLEPLDAPAQLVHGDLTGNVLFADGAPPAVIDLSLYWRPVAFGSAVVVADAMVWHGADEQLLAAVGHVQRFGQYFVRALIFRLVTELIVRGGPRDAGEPYSPAIELARRLAPGA